MCGRAKVFNRRTTREQSPCREQSPGANSVASYLRVTRWHERATNAIGRADLVESDCRYTAFVQISEYRPRRWR
jgi:hypothetical protein